MKKEKKILLFIFFLALFLRVYKLPTFPFGFHADEVRVGWNAYSILKTGADDRGNILALYYNTFGDYRPTGIFYLTIPSILIFGVNEFAVRFPSALLGALTIFPLFFFVKEISKDKKLALIAGFLLAINPWHISTSRATSEVIISVFIALTGFYYFLKGVNYRDKKSLVISGLLLVASYFFYHSIRVLAPLFIAIILAYKFFLAKNKKLFKPAVLVFVFLSLVTFSLTLNKESRGRFSQVSIFSDLDVQYELSRMPFEEGPNKVFVARLFHNKPSTYTRRFINEYTKYFSSNFFLESTTPKPARYQTVGVGLLTYVEVILFVAGLVSIAQKKSDSLPLVLLLASPFAAALTTEDAPNLHRSLFMIIFITIIGAYGFRYLLNLRIRKYQKYIPHLIFTALSLNLIFYLHMYFVHSKVHLPLYRNVGAKELALVLKDIQGNYDKIITTNIPDDPYPWIAFFTKKDPKTFNKDAIQRKEGVWTHDNFMFTGQRCPSRDAFKQPDVDRLLVIDAEGCATESNLVNRSDVRILKRILRPDESEVYVLWDNVIE